MRDELKSMCEAFNCMPVHWLWVKRDIQVILDEIADLNEPYDKQEWAVRQLMASAVETPPRNDTQIERGSVEPL